MGSFLWTFFNMQICHTIVTYSRFTVYRHHRCGLRLFARKPPPILDSPLDMTPCHPCLFLPLTYTHTHSSGAVVTTMPQIGQGRMLMFSWRTGTAHHKLEAVPNALLALMRTVCDLMELSMPRLAQITK